MRWLIQFIRRGLLTGGAFLLFFTIGMVLSYIVLPAVHLVSSRDLAARRCRRIVARTWVVFHGYMRVSGLLQYDPHQTKIVLPATGAVVIANHPTLVDVTAIVSACPDLIFVAKRQMFRSPLVGPLLRLCDQIEAGTGVLAGVAVIDDAVDRLRLGRSVLLFPEGTRSPKGAVGQFFPGALEIAARAGVPVVPLLVQSDPPALMRGQPWHDIPERTVRLTVTQLATFNPPAGPPVRARDALRALYVQALAEDAPRSCDVSIAPGARTRSERGSA
jgi:1-acyl-sn-glycerol-3-phosphate acyltransferase